MQGIKKCFFVVLFILLGVVITAPQDVVKPVPVPEVSMVPVSVPSEVLNPSVKIIVPDGIGAGVIISDIFILTAAHNLVEYDFFRNPIYENKYLDKYFKVEILLKTPNGNVPIQLPAQTILFDPKSDLALLKVSYTFNEEAVIPIKDELYAGCPLWIIGAPAGQSQKLTTLGYFGKHRDANEKSSSLASQSSQSSNASQPGNSGGGVYNANTKRLVGIVTAANEPNISEFTPLYEIVEF